MNTYMRSVVLMCVGVGMAMLTPRAFAAVQFTVTGAEFTDVVGADEMLTWSVAATTTPIDLGDIGVGDVPVAFTYGTFTTDDIGFGVVDALFDALDWNDRFTANLLISPPDPAASFNTVGRPNASVSISWSWRDGLRVAEYVSVDFDNNPMVVTYANGLSYAVTFRDTDVLSANGSLDLQAEITLLSQAVPEPAAVFVWTVLGLTFGFGIHRSRARRKKA